MIKFIDLFAGMGGTRLGVERACRALGIESKCLFTSEKKPYAVSVYNEYYGENNKPIDITKIKSADIPDFDLLLGGFPCQAFSDAGTRRGFADARGTLFFEIARILKDKRPKAFILENVEGLVRHDKGQTFAIILNILEGLGYKVSYKVLNSKDFSTAQNRKRIYITGNFKSNLNLDFEPQRPVLFKDIQERGLPLVDNDLTRKILAEYTPEQIYGRILRDKRCGGRYINSWEFSLRGEVSEDEKILLRNLSLQSRRKKWAEIVSMDHGEGMPLTIDHIRTFHDRENLQETLDRLCELGYLKKERPKKRVGGKRVPDFDKDEGYAISGGKLTHSFSEFLNPEGLTPTLVATDVDKIGVIDNGGIRHLSLVEGLRLFGYPDDYPIDKIKKRQAYDLLGNTLCINIIEEIAKRLILEL